MATNYVQPGKVLPLTAPAAVTSGLTYKVGSLIVVAMCSADSGAEFQGATEGVFTLVKATGSAWTEGELLYWDASASKWTDVAEDNTLAGYAAAAAGSSDATGKVFVCQMGATVLNAT